ncbi:MAG: OsmC family protein [Steroidobacteraceae bacterium]
MANHTVSIRWKGPGPNFLKGQFSREHTWSFDGGAAIPASASPAVVPPPNSNPAGVDPEEAFVASIASCHMLTFLYLAGRKGFEVEAYEDDAVGVTSRNEQGATWVSRVTLRPKIGYRGSKHPTAAELEQLHHQAHEQCFIANSVKTAIHVE